MGPYIFWLGERDCRFATGHAPAALRPSNRGSHPHLPETKKIGALMGPYIFWLGERDSNPRWRSQSPQSYH